MIAIQPRATFALTLVGLLGLLAFAACASPLDPGFYGDDDDDGPDGGVSEECEPSGDLEPVAGALAVPLPSFDRGFFDAPFDVVLTAAAGTSISYTTDGSEPDEANGTIAPSPVTVHIEGTTVLRARALQEGVLSSRVRTTIYLFPEQTLYQPYSIDGFPKWSFSLWPEGARP